MILVIGEMPGHHPGQPLAGLSGSRLAKLAGTTLDDFIRHTDRRNLIKERTGWNARIAGEAASQLMYECAGFEGVLLCGRRVATAFGLGHLPFLNSAWIYEIGRRNPEYVILPHPSGKNRWWNNEDNVAGARRVMQRVWESYA